MLVNFKNALKVRKESIVRFPLDNSHIGSKAIEEKEGNPKKIGKIVWAAIKCFVFVACVGGFAYQITEFITHFYSYPTVVTIDLQEPDSFVIPALTVCNLNLIKRSAYCEKFPEECTSLKKEDYNSFCTESPHYCRLDNDPFTFKIPKNPKFYINEMDEYRSKKNLEDLVDHEDYYVTHNGFLEYFNGPFFMDSNLPCYTLNNRAIVNRKPKKGEFHKYLRKSRMGRATYVDGIYIQINEVEIFDYLSKPGALLSVHSPFTVVDPGLEGAVLKPNRKYKVHIRLEENHLLKFPYKTDCRDYEEEWTNNGRTGPRSQQVCVNSCWNEYNLKCFNCSKPLMQTKLQETCITLVQASCGIKIEGDKLKACLATCKNACKERKYVYRVQEQPYVNRAKNLRGGKARIHIDVVIDEPEVLVFAHKPQYLAVELFSYIGGFLGCWLGISIWSSSSTLLKILNHVKVQLKKLKQEKTKEKEEDLCIN